MDDLSKLFEGFDDLQQTIKYENEHDRHHYHQEQPPLMLPLWNSYEIKEQQSLNLQSGHHEDSAQPSQKCEFCNNTNRLSTAKSVRKVRATARVPSYTFRTKSEKDVIEDGYKWRKYGKKMIKSSPYPRNYYKCSEKSCGVRKRVDRDPLDKSMVLTTYKGTHNHERPGAVYCYYFDAETSRLQSNDLLIQL